MQRSQEAALWLWSYLLLKYKQVPSTTAKRTVKVQLPYERGQFGMFEELRQDFVTKFIDVDNDEGPSIVVGAPHDRFAVGVFRICHMVRLRKEPVETLSTAGGSSSSSGGGTFLVGCFGLRRDHLERGLAVRRHVHHLATASVVVVGCGVASDRVLARF